MFERFAATARTVVQGAAGEALRRGDDRIGTEHLLLSLLAEPTGAALLGTTADAARAAAGDLDRQALLAVGIDLGDFRPAATPAAGKRPPFTSGARKVLARTLAVAAAEKTRRIELRHLLLALLERDHPDPVAALLTALNIDPAVPRSRLGAARP